MDKKVSLFNQALVWFGAGISIAEILTGTYLAPLGLQKGMLAIILGHLIGGVLFYLAASISAKQNKSSMESVKSTFGEIGGKFFAILNVLQLFGWTAIMIYDGAVSATSVFKQSQWLWTLVIGALVVVWIAVDISSMEKVNIVAMLGLFVLSLLLCYVIVTNQHKGKLVDSITFGAALELSASMPLSWLPVVGDYMVNADQPKKSALVSTIVYTLASSWMFAIGMASSIMTGSSNIATIMVMAGMGLAGLLIIVFSTVTTTFLDALSAGISSEAIISKLFGKKAALVVGVLGTICALLFPMDNITNFLLLIGSIFAPMIAVMVAAEFSLAPSANKVINLPNLLVWLFGFIIYRVLMQLDLPTGYTVPDVTVTFLLALLVNRLVPARK